MKRLLKKNKGFTLVELMVTIGIFVLMTGLLLAKYTNFNQGIILTNLAYDVALSIRSAQSYGLNVKSAPTESINFSDEFKSAYGVNFTKDTSSFYSFVDKDRNGELHGADTIISTTNIKRGSKVSDLCVSNSESNCDTVTSLDISFERPNPVAKIYSGGDKYNYAKITLSSSDGSKKTVIIRSTGQIAVESGIVK